MVNKRALSQINSIERLILIIYILFPFFQINYVISGICKADIINLTDTSCFNNLLILDNKKWRAGHASTNKKGDIFVEFSIDETSNNDRLIYGLKKNGRYFYNETEFGYKEISFGQQYGRFESLNLFVSLKNDNLKNTEYLFSYSCGESLVEIIDVENNINYGMYVKNFFGISEVLYSYDFSLFEIGNSNEYIAVFIERYNNNYNPTYLTIKKFQVNYLNYESDPQIQNEIIKTEKIQAYYNRIVSAFRLDIPELIVVVYIHSNRNLYLARFYNDNLERQGNDENDFILENSVKANNNIFVKGIGVNGEYAAFAYFKSNSIYSLVFNLRKYKNYYTFDSPLFYHEINYNVFYSDVQSCWFHKLEDDRIVLLTLQDFIKGQIHNYFQTLYTFLFDFYDNYNKMKLRSYALYFPERRFAKEMSCYLYNGYILFSATLSEITLDENPANIFSIMMIFGFGNGTDLEIDISPYLMDTGYYNNENNLYDYLIEKLNIDNNLFDYEKYEKIRLISICDELLLYKGRLNIDKEENIFFEIFEK